MLKKYRSEFDTSELNGLPEGIAGVEKWLVTQNPRLVEWGDKDPEDVEAPTLAGYEAGDICIIMRNAVVLEIQPDCTAKILGVDENYLEQKRRYKQVAGFKEYTSFKQIERTSKADAWGRAAFYLKHHVLNDMKEDNPLYKSTKHLLEFFEEKEQSHLEYLSQLPTEYEYATQSFKPKQQENF